MANKKSTKKYIRLCGASNPWQANAQITSYHRGNKFQIKSALINERWTLIPEGYRKAANILVAHVVKTRANIDFLVFPIIFLCRQHLELRMKEIIVNGGKLLRINDLIDHKKSINIPEVPANHDLEKVWEVCNKILERIFEYNESVPKCLKTIDICISDFNKIDPSSMAFRYPSDKKNIEPFAKNVTHINIYKILDKIKETADLLDGASTGIDHFLTEQSEYLADHGCL